MMPVRMDMKAHSRQPAGNTFLRMDVNARNAQRGDLFHRRVAIRDQIKKSGGEHVARRSHRTL